MKSKPYITIDAFTDEHVEWITQNATDTVHVSRRYKNSGKRMGATRLRPIS